VGNDYVLPQIRLTPASPPPRCHSPAGDSTPIHTPALGPGRAARRSPSGTPHRMTYASPSPKAYHTTAPNRFFVQPISTMSPGGLGPLTFPPRSPAGRGLRPALYKNAADAVQWPRPELVTVQGQITQTQSGRPPLLGQLEIRDPKAPGATPSPYVVHDSDDDFLL
jgi:hypothetical protein